MAQGSDRSFTRVLAWLLFALVLAVAAMGSGVYLGDAHRAEVRNVFQLFGLAPRSEGEPEVVFVPPSIVELPQDTDAEADGGVAEDGGEDDGGALSAWNPEEALPFGLPRSRLASGTESAEDPVSEGSASGSVVSSPSSDSDGGQPASDGGRPEVGIVGRAPARPETLQPPLDPIWPDHPLLDGGFALEKPELPEVRGSGPMFAQCPAHAAAAKGGADGAPTGADKKKDSDGTDGAAQAAKQDSAAKPDSKAEALAAASQATSELMAMPVTLRVKVLVDERFVAAHPDWLSQVQNLFARTSSALRLAIRVELELLGAMRFAEPMDGVAVSAVYERLRRYEPEGADVVLALLELPELGDEGCPPVDAEALHNGRYGVIGLDATGSHVATTLRCLGLLMGAESVEDGSSIAYRLGSWMRPDGVTPTGKPPWLDPDNRLRLMRRKALPFGENNR